MPAGEKPRPVFIGLGALAILAGIYVALGSASDERAQAKRSAEAVSWSEQVIAAADPKECTKNGETRALWVSKVRSQLAVWRERERVDRTQMLKSLLQVHRAQACASPEGGGEELALEKRRLERSLSKAIRAHHLGIVRASRLGRWQDALAQVRRLRAFIEHHQGPLVEELAQLERQLETKLTD